VLLVTDVACAEGRALLGDGLTTVAVKTGLGATSVRQIPPLRARELIEDGAKRALVRCSQRSRPFSRSHRSRAKTFSTGSPT
jgi:D-aminopeptidase